MSETRINIRVSQEVKAEAERQAESLGIDLTSYIKLIVKLDPSKLIAQTLKIKL